MKDEEMAEQYADGIATPDLDCSFRVHIFEASKDGFLAGLKAGRPQWHKVADGDLPKEDIYLVIRLNDKNTCYKYCAGFWEKEEKCFHTLFCDKVDAKDIIAWCEIPTFDKETDK